MQAEARSRVNLKQLIYSSLDAITAANTRMSRSMIDTIMKFSDDKGHDDDGYPIVQLKTLQLVYDQIKHDELDNLCSEKIGLEIPVLSVIPLNSLKVSRSKIQFSAEVQEMETTDDELNIYTKITAANTERGAQTPRIDFEIELESDPAAEGLSRIVDQLGHNFIPNVHEKNPVDANGAKLGAEETERYDKQKKLRLREMRLDKLLAQLNDIQRIDEDTDGEGETFKELEPYKAELEARLSDTRKKIMQTDIEFEFELEEKEEPAPQKPEGERYGRRK